MLLEDGCGIDDVGGILDRCPSEFEYSQFDILCIKDETYFGIDFYSYWGFEIFEFTILFGFFRFETNKVFLSLTTY